MLIESGRANKQALPFVYFYRGSAYFKKKNFDAAIADYTKAIDANPKYVEAYGNRGNAYNEKDEYALAIADYNKAIELAPKNSMLHSLLYTNRGLVYERIGDKNKAIADYKKAIVIDPSNSIAKPLLEQLGEIKSDE